jgi:hypothetical protein
MLKPETCALKPSPPPAQHLILFENRHSAITVLEMASRRWSRSFRLFLPFLWKGLRQNESLLCAPRPRGHGSPTE